MKMVESKLIEFANIKTLEKFTRSSNILFSDGHVAYNWFVANKKEILSSNNKYCKLVQSQYENHLKSVKKAKLMETTQSIHNTFVNANITNEFKNIKDIRKFDKDSNIYLSNGMTTYDWFIANSRSILVDGCGMYKEIREQYFNAKKTQKIIERSRDKYSFYKDDRLYKFNEFSGIELPSSKLMSGVWFLQNKESILNSDNPVDVEIAKQYKKYEMYYALVLEFYYEKDLLKFDEHSNVRFKTGSLMPLWWEVNKESILSSEFLPDKLIKKQYEEYLTNVLGSSFKKKWLHFFFFRH